MNALHLLSWNLGGLDTDHLDSRTEMACLDIILGITLQQAMAGQASPPLPEVLCLQEVVRRAHQGNLAPHLKAAGFVLYPEEPAKADSEYSMIAVRAPWQIMAAKTVRFEYSPLARDYLEVELEHSSGARVRVLTAHMESLKSGSEARLEQMLEIDRRLHENPHEPAVFAGDTNLRKSERAKGFTAVDAHALAGAPKQYEHTWWPPDSRRGFRFDQIWMGSGPSWVVDEFKTRRRPKITDHAAVQSKLHWASQD